MVWNVAAAVVMSRSSSTSAARPLCRNTASAPAVIVRPGLAVRANNLVIVFVIVIVF